LPGTDPKTANGCKIAFMLMAWTLAWFLLSARSQTKASCTATGDLEIVQFHSKIFPADRKLRILLPEGYRLPENRDRRYPVLYLNDGQNLFDICTSQFSGMEWRVDETVQKLTAERAIAPLIVVGIDNGGKRERAREYLPYVDDTLKPAEPNPEGKLYPHFLLDEVVPYVESHFRVLPGESHRALGGASYGAGVALYTVVTHPGSFSRLLLESPSVYADDYRLLRDAGSVRVWPNRIFIGTGTIDEPVDDVRKLEEILQKAGLGADRLRVVVQTGGKHSEKWWGGRLPDALRFLFPPPS
jgi:enterochelin esterase-like enzyme